VVRSKKNSVKQNGKGGNLGFEEKLWAAADKLRGQMDSAEYKHIVLGLIFLKSISDQFEERYDQLEIWGLDSSSHLLPPEDSDKFTKVQADCLVDQRFEIPESVRWSNLKAQANQPNIGNLVDEAMMVIEKQNSSLNNILPKAYSSLESRRLSELIAIINTIDLGEKTTISKDVLGRVYEYFLGRFANWEGKGGEFYTPQSVVKLLVEMTQPYQGKIYDPCCGSGGIFVQSEKFVLAAGGKASDILIYGQESNQTTWRLCKMNLAIRGIEANIGECNADTLNSDLHPDLKADFILANPPFNMSDWEGYRLHQDQRWNYGIPPSSNANFAWIQHIIYHLSNQGIAGFVLSNGSLNHGQIEGEIRSKIIEDDLIDCIISLPIQLFYTTQIAASLWFIAKNKKDDKWRNRTGETLFIYAANFGEMIDRTHRTIADDEIAKIANTYNLWRSRDQINEYQDIPGFCKSATIEEIRYHKMSLVPGRYVGFDESLTKQWDITELRAEFTDVETRIAEIDKASNSALNVLKELLYG